MNDEPWGRRTKGVFFGLIWLGTCYLLLPAPADFPPLANSVKSTEPGDTVQIANVTAYYTDLSRRETVDFYQQYFSRSPFLGIPLLTYKLNHPPERIREVLRDTQQSTYVEELVHPLRESVFINGFEWNNDPFTPPWAREQNILRVDGRVYQFKVTLFYQPTPVWQRLLVYYLVLAALYLLVGQARQLLNRWRF